MPEVNLGYAKLAKAIIGIKNYNNKMFFSSSWYQLLYDLAVLGDEIENNKKTLNSLTKLSKINYREE